MYSGYLNINFILNNQLSRKEDIRPFDTYNDKKMINILVKFTNNLLVYFYLLFHFNYIDLNRLTFVSTKNRAVLKCL